MARVKINKQVFIFAFFYALFFFGYLFFSKTQAFQGFVSFAQGNIVIFFVFLVVVKFIGIIYPPFAGGILTLGAVPIIGWKLAFLADFVGGFPAGIINYFIGRKFGLRVVRRIFGQDPAKYLDKLEIREGREIEGLILSRLVFGTISVEVVQYLAGILRINFWKFLVSALVYEALFRVPFFWLFYEIIVQKGYIMGIIVILVGLPILYKYRRRYLE